MLRLIECLADGRFHSGTEISGHIGISRSAVCKQIGKLKECLGLEIFSVHGKGYRLAEPIQLLTVDRIRQAMTDESLHLISDIEIISDIDSTNSYLMNRVSKGIESGHVCFAERQTSGRGRRGRQWVSPFGKNIYLSVYWRSMLGLSQLSGLSLAAGASVVSALKKAGCNNIGLKWPNDVLINGKKVAGLLLEVSGEQNGPANVVLGIGVNIQMPESDAQAIDQPWEDLSAVMNTSEYHRNRLSGMVLESLLLSLKKYESSGLASALKEWREHDLFEGKQVSLRLADKYVHGIYRGIDDNGALLLQQGRHLIPYHGGEISLRLKS